jgi:uroporphyrinogen-III decarboxylase
LPSGRDYLYGNIPSAENDVWDQSELIQNRDVIDMLVRLVPLEELDEQGVFDLPKKIVKDKGDAYFVIVYDSTPYTAGYLLGFQGLMLAFLDNPDNLKYFIDRVMRQREPILQGFAQAGYDGIYTEEIFSGTDIISPKYYDEFVFPHNAEYFRVARTFGLLTAYYVCGNPMPILSRILELECDAVAFEESKKNFSIEIDEVVAMAGSEKCIFGNIDAPYYGLHATVDEIVAEVCRQIEAGLGAKGFVVSTGSPLPLQTPIQNIDSIVRASHAYEHR